MCPALDNTTISVVIPKPLSRPQVIEPMNQVLAVVNSWGLKRHMRLNSNKTNSFVVNLSRTIAPGYGVLTLGGAELEEVKSSNSWGNLRLLC